VDIRNFLKKITDNWPAKVLSLLLALFLALVQRVNTMNTRSFDVPLSVTNAGNGLAPASPFPAQVRIIVRTNERELDAMSVSDFSVEADLSIYKKPNTYNVPLRVRATTPIDDISAIELKVQPPDLKVTLDTQTGRSLPITPSYKGAVASGYELLMQKITPAEIYVEGPRSIVDALQSVPTEPIDLTGRDADISRIVQIGALSPFVHVNETSVQFDAEIRSLAEIGTWSGLLIAFKNLPPALVVSNNPSPRGSVQLQAPRRAIASFKPPDDALYVDCASIIAPGEYKDLPVLTNIDSHYQILKQAPATLSITVTSAPPPLPQEKNHHE
jgi:hypothetical protein